MRSIYLLLFSIASLQGFSQFEKSTSIHLTANFNFALTGVATNTGGAGAGCSASFFGKHRLQALVEANANYFFGDKFLIIETSTGRKPKTAGAHSIKAGPQYFLTKNMALSITYGAAWYTIREFEYTMSDAFKYSVTGFFGPKKRFVTQLSFTSVSSPGNPIRFIALAAGHRF